MRILALLLLSGVARAEPDPALKDALHAALSVRHGAPSCEALAEGRDPVEVRDALAAIAEEVSRPGWVPLRAAACVVEQAAEDEAALEVSRRWVEDEARPGLALVVARNLDALPEERAVPLARRAVERAREDRRLGTHLPGALRESRHEGVRALATAE